MHTNLLCITVLHAPQPGVPHPTEPGALAKPVDYSQDNGFKCIKQKEKIADEPMIYIYRYVKMFFSI